MKNTLTFCVKLSILITEHKRGQSHPATEHKWKAIFFLFLIFISNLVGAQECIYLGC